MCIKLNGIFKKRMEFRYFLLNRLLRKNGTPLKVCGTHNGTPIFVLGDKDGVIIREEK